MRYLLTLVCASFGMWLVWLCLWGQQKEKQVVLYVLMRDDLFSK